MGIEMKVPAVGQSVKKMTVISWFKKEGDFVNLDEIVCEIESEKATFELPADASGILHIFAEKGAAVKIGEVLCRIEPVGK